MIGWVWAAVHALSPQLPMVCCMPPLRLSRRRRPRDERPLPVDDVYDADWEIVDHTE